MTEHQEQVKFVTWVRVNHPDLLIHSIPNGANLAGSQLQRVKQWNKLRAEGALAGVPDLFIPELRLYVEMKAARGVLSDKQKKIIPRLEKAGYKVAVCYSGDEAINMVKSLISN
jgi:hypothetical protein